MPAPGQVTSHDDVLTVEHLRDLHVDAALPPHDRAHLSAASGVVWLGDQIIVLADDEHHVGVFDIEGNQPGRLVRVLAGDLPDDTLARKRIKPDAEALIALPSCAAWPGGALLAMGSGSLPNRQTALLIPLGAMKPRADIAPIVLFDLTALYAPLRDHFTDLNIEGAFICADELRLLQRGNLRSPNASIAFSLSEMMDWLAASANPRPVPRYLRIQHHALGQVGDVPLCFTDGTALPDGRWLFSAAAEDTDNSYADGICVAAAIGIVDAQGVTERIWRLPTASKVEGVAVRAEGDALIVLMVTDADDPARAAQLLRARLQMHAQ